MNEPVQLYGIIITVFLLSVMVAGRLLRVQRGISILAAASALQIGQVIVLALWGARFDTGWLKPATILMSISTLLIPACLLFAILLWSALRISLWKSVMIAALSHVGTFVVIELTLLGFWRQLPGVN